jgi:hypothetical protein
MGEKECKTCNQSKTLDWFELRSDTGKYRNSCHACRALKVVQLGKLL